MHHHFLRKRERPVVRARARVKRDVLEGAANVSRKFVAELLRRLGEAMVVILTPSLVHIVDSPRSSAIGVFRYHSFLHAFLEEANNGIVLSAVGLTSHMDGFRLGEPIAVGDDRLQGKHSLVDNALPLGVHLVEKQLVLELHWGSSLP